MRKWHPNTFSGLWRRELWLAGHSSSSKQNNRKIGRLSLPTSLSLQGDMGMGDPHSISSICVGGGQTCDDDEYWGKNRQKKKQHVVNFQTKESSGYLVINGWKNRMSCRLFITGCRRIMSSHLVVKRWRHIMNYRFFVGEWRQVIWDMKETQIPK